jgi:hypothetical protein
MPFPFRAVGRNLRRGRLMAAALAGAWRLAPDALALLPHDLAAVAPLLLRTGGGGLGWWRVRHSGWAPDPATFELQQAYRLHSLQACLHADRLRAALALLRSRGVDAILSKGWAVARLYPEPGLRPYGDLDLCVPPGQGSTAAAVLTEAGGRAAGVDLHRGVPELEDRSWEEVYRRSRLARLGDVSVRILGPEDQLRLLCLHLLRHGAWRPLWLCDIGAVVESVPPGFDWDYCLSGHRRLSAWVRCALGLAVRLLGARVAPPEAVGRVPRWLRASVLRQWGAELAGDSHSRDERPLASYLRRPAGLLRALRCRWPNPVEAVVKMRAGPSTRVPGVLFQLCLAAGRLGQFVSRLAARLGNPGGAPDLPFTLHEHPAR